jgi:hypothetical protein
MRRSVVLVFAGLLFSGLWGQAPKQTFNVEVNIAMSSLPGTFTVSEQGYDWAITGKSQYHSEGLTPWKELRHWSCNGEIYGFALTLHHQKGVSGFRFRHDDLVTVVNNYLKKYAGDKLDGEGCNPES